MSTIRKVYIHTMGCQMNEYDSAKMADVLAHSEGAVRVEDPERADILLMNTFSWAFSRTEQVFMSTMSALSGSSTRTAPSLWASTSAILAESYSFI